MDLHQWSIFLETVQLTLLVIMIISLLATKQRLTAAIDEKMRKIFYSFLISCFIFTIISCGKTTEENVNDTVSKTNDTVFGTG